MSEQSARERATRKVMMSPEFMERFTTRDAEGNRLSVNWGEPDPDGFYEPVITTHREDNIVAAYRAQLAEAVRELRDHNLLLDGRYLVDRQAALDLIEREP